MSLSRIEVEYKDASLTAQECVVAAVCPKFVIRNNYVSTILLSHFPNDHLNFLEQSLVFFLKNHFKEEFYNFKVNYLEIPYFHSSICHHPIGPLLILFFSHTTTSLC